MKTQEKSIEEIVTEIILSVGRTGDVEGEIAKALQAERQKREEAVEAERERDKKDLPRAVMEYIEKNKDYQY